MDDARTDRMIKNEALFRSVNERVKELTERLSLGGEADQPAMEEYLCECADIECTERVQLTREEYEHMRSNALWFLVVPGHVVPEIERVVEENERFAVVAKAVGEASGGRARSPSRPGRGDRP